MSDKKCCNIKIEFVELNMDIKEKYPNASFNNKIYRMLCDFKNSHEDKYDIKSFEIECEGEEMLVEFGKKSSGV